MRSDGTGERLLTENYYQEAPSWSPNGRVLIFYRETKSDSKGKGFSTKLWSIDITGVMKGWLKQKLMHQIHVVLIVIKIVIF